MSNAPRLSLLYLQCGRNPAEALKNGSYKRFREIVEREGIKSFREGGPGHVELFYKTVEEAGG